MQDQGRFKTSLDSGGGEPFWKVGVEAYCAVARVVQVRTHHAHTGREQGGVPCAARALCEKLAVLHHREFGKFRRLKGRH